MQTNEEQSTVDAQMYNKTEKKTYEHQRNGMDFAGRLRKITIQVSGFHLSTIFFNHHET